MPETPFHLGPELEHANKPQHFFRLFSLLASSHDFQYFGLAEVPVDGGGFNLKGDHSLHNCSEAWFNNATGVLIERNDPIVQHLLISIAPRSLDLRNTSSALLRVSGSTSAVVVPLHTIIGKRYGLVLCGNAQPVNHHQLASIALDAAVIFQRYFETILSVDFISGLTDRELEIVRWTSEGKTSAEIAIILDLSEHTVNSYTAALLRKLNVGNRAQMVASALRKGLIS